MDKSRFRLATTLAVLVTVLAVALYLQFLARSEQQGLSTSEPVTFDMQASERRETAAISEAPEKSAPDELPILEQGSFSDTEGLFATVEWRNRESLSNDDYPKSYAELRVLAEEGDVEATRHLTRLLQSCQRAVLPMSEAEVLETVAEIRLTYSYPLLRDGKFEFLPSAAGELSHKMSSAEFERFVDAWHSNVIYSVRKCNDVTAAQREETDHWLGVLKSQGGARPSWREATQDMALDEKIAYVDNMWATGDPHALATYADIYGDYQLQLIDPSARMKSYAYIYAFYEAMIETAKHHSDAGGLARLRRSLKLIQENHSNLFSEYELRDAHELARQTIADNENCCIRLP